MGSPGFTSYEVDNDKRFQGALSRARDTATDLRIPFTLIAADFYRSQKSIFQLSGPGQYPDLSAQYKVAKQRKYGRIYPILKANGFLETAASVQNGPGNVTDIKERELVMGVDDGAVPQAKYHQSDDARSKIPLRKFLFIGPEAPQFAKGPTAGRPERWLNILNEFVLIKLAQTGVGEIK